MNWLIPCLTFCNCICTVYYCARMINVANREGQTFLTFFSSPAIILCIGWTMGPLPLPMYATLTLCPLGLIIIPPFHSPRTLGATKKHCGWLSWILWFDFFSSLNTIHTHYLVIWSWAHHQYSVAEITWVCCCWTYRVTVTRLERSRNDSVSYVYQEDPWELWVLFCF